MRTYNVNGKDVPSVTTVVQLLDNPHLDQWKTSLACDYIKDRVLDIWEDWNIDDIIEEAKIQHGTVLNELAEYGTATHSAMEDLLQGYEPVYWDDTMQEGCKKASEILTSHNIKVLGLEEFCWSDDFAGTVDLICEIDENIFLPKRNWNDRRVTAIIDFKTSKAYYESHKIQIAGYANCKNSKNNLNKYLTNVSYRGIMRIRDGRANIKAFNEDKWQNIFFALLDVYKNLKQ